jgi:hypothetical protein
MRAVVAVERGVIELNYMWLPTCVGMNAVLKQEMERELNSALCGRVLDDAALDEAHDLVVAFIEKKFPVIRGVERYLDGMKFLEVRR